MKKTILWKLLKLIYLLNYILKGEFTHPYFRTQTYLGQSCSKTFFYPGTHINKYEHHLGSVGKLY